MSNADLNTYFNMLEYRRPKGSVTETQFIKRFLMPLPGMQEDACGNLICEIGNDPNILWSSHTDTVHNQDQMQTIQIDGDFVRLGSKSKSNCLGADCTTGVWIMREMILANVPGLYIFHFGEEHGGIGSNYIANHTPEILQGIKAAIAFDRYDVYHIITHQFDRCCSDAFADSLALQMPGYKRNTDGIFTDTANYVDLIGECSNISVGYFDHHTARECQSIPHLKKIRDLMINLDQSRLVFNRQPGEVEPSPSYTRFNWTRDYTWDDEPRIADICKKFPNTLGSVLEKCGFTYDELSEWVAAELRNSVKKKAS